MSAAWLTYPLTLDSGREFECDPLTTDQCDFYKERWHFWYESNCNHEQLKLIDKFLLGT
jgi:hypothetical protein